MDANFTHGTIRATLRVLNVRLLAVTALKLLRFCNYGRIVDQLSIYEGFGLGSDLCLYESGQRCGAVVERTESEWG